jgi:hypothetical protein
MSILKAFVEHFMEFVDDIQRIFPNDRDITVARNSIEAIRKINPRKIIEFWKSYITQPYFDRIERGDITFFLEKEYGEDIQGAQNGDTILEAIERLREPIRQMGDTNQAKSMKYIKNLTKLSTMY